MQRYKKKQYEMQFWRKKVKKNKKNARKVRASPCGCPYECTKARKKH